MADNNLPEFLQGYDDLDGMDIDFGIEAVSADELGEKTVEGQRATEILESNVEGISQVEQKIDDVYGTLVALKSLLDFDELNIEGKLDKILTAVKDTPAPVAATTIEGTVVAEESAETREKLDKIVAALGDPEKRKADVERRLQEAIENHKDLCAYWWICRFLQARRFAF